MNGLVKFTKEGETKILNPGDSVHIKPKENHSFEGLEDSEIMEISTTHSDDDVVRLEESGKR